MGGGRGGGLMKRLLIGISCWTHSLREVPYYVCIGFIICIETALPTIGVLSKIVMCFLWILFLFVS